ncbi:unnamed protein product [Mesocestoides corti]|uniref:Nesprin-1 spectrin repeats region domain-containing protein n=2 Tax=Mesocestoides corti TaxID=53468 RepID=A0A3P6GRL9_MESCO|nr:unnamed protein product [Mesocestoides corti]
MQIKDSNTQAEEEREFLIHIKELISRIRHEPLSAQDLLLELEELYQTEQEHQSLTSGLIEMGKRKRQGILLGILPSELAEVEAEWTRIKSTLDEWRWRLDDSLPGDWARVGRWLGQLERSLERGARLAVELNAASESKTDAATRSSRFLAQMADLQEALQQKTEVSELLRGLAEKNSRDESTKLPASVVRAIEKRFSEVSHDAEIVLRRTRRLHLRWKLAHEIDDIRQHLNHLKSTRCQRLDEATESLDRLKKWKAEKGLPEAMEKDISELTNISKEPDDVQSSNSSSSTAQTTSEEQPLSGFLAIQIKAGGGALVMRDVAETERAEAIMFLASLRVRWAEALEDLAALEKSSISLVETWQAYETEAQTLYAWMMEAEEKLKGKDTSSKEKRFLLSQVKKWRERLNALQDLGATLIGQSSVSAGQAINTELVTMLKRLESISNEVTKSCQAETVESLKRDFEAVVGRMNDMLQATVDLLNKEVQLPQTTSIQRAEEATLEYRNLLKAAKESLLKDVEIQYLLAKEISEKLMAAARDGDIDYAEADRCMQETDRLRQKLMQMAEESIDNRLLELSMAMREAVLVAVRLAEMSEWIEEAELATNLEIPTTPEEVKLDALSSISPDEAIRRLKMHCNSINAQQKALEEAEERLKELKTSGLRCVDVSQLEMAIAETRERIKVMLEQTLRRENLLIRQRQAREVTMSAADAFETWLVEAEGVITNSLDAVLPLNANNLIGATRLSHWSLHSLEEQRNAHETFCEERMEDGSVLLKNMDECYGKFMEIWPEISVAQPMASDSEAMVYIKEVVSRVKLLTQRYLDVSQKSSRALLTVRFAIIDFKIGEKLLEATERLRQEELRIENGEEVSLILSEHEAYFFSPDFVEELPAMMVEMEHVTSELVKLEPEAAVHFAKRSEVRSKTHSDLKFRAERLATNMRDLPERWLDFDAKLGGLEQWTNELEGLANQLCSEGFPGSEELMDPEVAAEIARRYRAMLEKFEQMADSTGPNISMAERLNKMLQDLIAEGGLSPAEVANRRTSLARVLNSLHDMEAVTSSVLQTAEKIVGSLDFQAAVANEQDRAKRIRNHVEEVLNETSLQSLDSEEMRRLLAEREALIARVNEEKKASLALLMHRSTPQPSQEHRMRPAEERLLQVWEDVDRMMEEKAASMRTAAQASEQFDEVRNRLSILLGGANFLLKGSPNPGLATAFSRDGVSREALEAFAVDAGDDVEHGGSVEDIAARGPSALQQQVSAIRAHLESLEKAEEDIRKLRAAADTISEQLGPEKSAELESIIAKLERDLASTKSALAARLAALESANSRWTEICENARRLETTVNIHESTLEQLRLHVDEVAIENDEESDIHSIGDVYHQYLKKCVQEVSQLQSTVADFRVEIKDVDSQLLAMLTVKKMDEDGNLVETTVDSVDPEVADIQKTLASILLRQNGLSDACTSLEVRITSTMSAIDEYSKLVDSMQAYLAKVGKIRETEVIFSDLPDAVKVKEQLKCLLEERQAEFGDVAVRMRTFISHLNKVPQLAAADNDLRQRWEEAANWLSTRASFIDALITDWRTWSNEVNQLSDELTQLAEDVERACTKAIPTARRGNLVTRQLEQLRLLKARWKGLKPQTEVLLAHLSSGGGGGGSKLTMATSDHVVPRRYTMVGDQVRGLYTMLEDLNAKLEDELDAQNKFTRDVERLIHMISMAEKRLSKVTGIWIPSAPTLLLQRIAQPQAQHSIDDSKPLKEMEGGTEKAVDSYLNLNEAIDELKSLFAEITGPMRMALDSLVSRIDLLDNSQVTAQDRLQPVSREMNLLALRALKRQYICEMSLAYGRSRESWCTKLRGMRLRQEQLISSGETVELLSSVPPTADDTTTKALKAIPVDVDYRNDCGSWLNALTAAKVEILAYKFTAEVPQIPEVLRDVEEEVQFEADFTPQELDTASIAAGIFFVTGRRDEVVSSAASSLEPFSFYVDVGRLISDCDRLKAGLLTHWNSLEVYCNSWNRFVRGCEDFERDTTEFLEKTFSLVKSAVDLTDTRLDRPGNHKRLGEIAIQFKDWHVAFASPMEVKDVTDLPLVSRLRDLKKEGDKLVELAPARTLSIRTLAAGNQKVLLDASVRLRELAYQLERLVRAFDNREMSIKEASDLLIDVEHQSGLRSVGSLASKLLGRDVSPELMDASGLEMSMSYQSDLDALLKRVASSKDLSHLLAKLSKARAFMRAHLPPKLVHLQQSSTSAICAFEAIMHEDAKPPIERLEDDTLRNRLTARCQHLSDFMDEAIKQLESKYQTMVLIETNIDRVCTWINEFLPRAQSVSHVLSVSATESTITEALQFAEKVEDPTDLLELFGVEHKHYSGLFELMKLEIHTDADLLSPVFGSQIKTVDTRLDNLVSAVNHMEELWQLHLHKDEVLSQESIRESENLAVLVDRLDKATLQSGFTLLPTASSKERVDAMELLSQSLEIVQQVRIEYVAMVSRIEALSQRCLNRDTLRMHLRRRRLLEQQGEEEEEMTATEDKPRDSLEGLSKHCANLTFRLASLDSMLKRSTENIYKRMTKIQSDAANSWSTHLNALAEDIERLSSLAELPLLLKADRREFATSFFTCRKQDVQDSQTKVDVLESELSQIADVHRIAERSSRYEEAPKPTGIGDEAFTQKNKARIASLRQNLAQYAVHIGELESHVTKTFSTTSCVEIALGKVERHLEAALTTLEESLDLRNSESCLAQLTWGFQFERQVKMGSPKKLESPDTKLPTTISGAHESS